MEREKLTAPCRISGAQFREYACYDALRRQKRWRRPAVFAVFFAALAALAYARAGTMRGAALLGGVLLAVGLGLPAVWFGSFLRSVRARAKLLDPRAIAYTLTLTADGVEVQKERQTASYAWERLDGACRLEHGCCLYVDAAHALLLPDDPKDAAWKMLAARLGSRAKDCRRAKHGRFE